MVAHVRADEACHRDLNHHFADIPSHQPVDSHVVSIRENPDCEKGTKMLVFNLEAGESKQKDEET